MRSARIGMAVAGLAGLMAASALAPAKAAMSQAEINEAAKTCVSDTGLSRAVEACSIVLDNTDFGPQAKASVLFFRGSSLQELGRNNEAIADLDRAIGLYETAVDKASWPKDVVSKIASSYFYRGLAKELLQQCEQAKLDFDKAAKLATDSDKKRNYERAKRAACS